jgi:Flp pilus assembly protein TadG
VRRRQRAERTVPWRSESGTAVVEFAVVATLLFLIVFGILDFGRAMNYWNNATQMANEGARWAVVNSNPGGSGQTLQQYVLSQGDTGEIRDPAVSRVCVTFPDGTDIGERVLVTVTMRFGFLPFISAALGGAASADLTGKAEMRLEQQPTNVSEGCYPPS